MTTTRSFIDYPVKIFCIGINKSGTVSLSEGLRILGINAMHNYANAMDIILATERRERHPLLDQFTAFADGPFFRCCGQLLEDFPDAKFIFTTRDQDDWINSRIIHVLYNRMFDKKDVWQHIDTESWETEYREAHSHVFETFQGNENFLEMNVLRGDSWDKLCPFLGLPVPKASFPHWNSGPWRLEKILNSYRPPKPGLTEWFSRKFNRTD